MHPARRCRRRRLRPGPFGLRPEAGGGSGECAAAARPWLVAQFPAPLQGVLPVRHSTGSSFPAGARGRCSGRAVVRSAAGIAAGASSRRGRGSEPERGPGRSPARGAGDVVPAGVPGAEPLVGLKGRSPWGWDG
ncbi:hypothetical protein SY2F82_26270 [Streptomyces sp. Y2F8-2]|nr:hypothetical protein SY2F82_26270 [Streptomyces sp. Y2F8-2]